MTEKQVGEASRYAVASVVNAMAAIEDLAVNGTRSLAQVSEAIGVSKSSAFRTLATLRDLGYVTHESRGSYRVSRSAFALASHVLEQFRIDELARPVLERLRLATGETVNLALLRGRELVYVVVLESREALRTAERRGAIAPLHASALGKAVLSQLDSKRMVDLLPDEPFQVFTSKTLTHITELESQLAAARRLGYATETEECAEGVACAAAPLPDLAGIDGAISVSVPLSRFPTKRMREVGILLKQAAGEISDIVLTARGQR